MTKKELLEALEPYIAIFKIGGACFIYENEETAIEGKGNGMLCWIFDKRYAIDLILKDDNISDNVLMEDMNGDFIQRNIIDVEHRFMKVGLID